MDTWFQRFPLRARSTSHSSKDLFCLYSPLSFGRLEALLGVNRLTLFLLFRAYGRIPGKLKGHPHFEVPFLSWFLSKKPNQMSTCQNCSVQSIRSDCSHKCAEMETYCGSFLICISPPKACTVNLHQQWKQK